MRLLGVVISTVPPLAWTFFSFLELAGKFANDTHVTFRNNPVAEPDASNGEEVERKRPIVAANTGIWSEAERVFPGYFHIGWHAYPHVKAERRWPIHLNLACHCWTQPSRCETVVMDHGRAVPKQPCGYVPRPLAPHSSFRSPSVFSFGSSPWGIRQFSNSNAELDDEGLGTFGFAFFLFFSSTLSPSSTAFHALLELDVCDNDER